MQEYWVGITLDTYKLQYVYDPKVQSSDVKFVHLFNVSENRVQKYKRVPMRNKIATCREPEVIQYSIQRYKYWLESADGIEFMNNRLPKGQPYLPRPSSAGLHLTARNEGQPEYPYRPLPTKEIPVSVSSSGKIRDAKVIMTSQDIENLPDALIDLEW